ncbi:MAG: serine/threonine-protein kinase, partial [Myxococcota bacterium]
VMELLDGHELAHHLQTEEIDAATGLRLVAEIASVLDAAHAVGIVHRDLKPENVFLVAGEDGQKHVKVLDFGIAKVMDSKTITHGILGTPLYISPEQIHGQVRTTPKSDIYALGMLAFTIFVGTAYWSVEHEESLYAFLSSVVAGPSVSACARAADEHDVILPPAFDAWFLEATATDPEARYPSASALVRGLAEALRLPRPDVGATTW